MKPQIELKNLKDIITKMNVMNINEAYVGFNKKGVDVYLFPCEKAQLYLTRKEIEENIKTHASKN